MQDIKRRIKGFFTTKTEKELRALSGLQKGLNNGIETLYESQKAHDAFLIALARLAFIKPSQLMREAQNVKANAEFILEMTKEAEKGK